MEKFIERNRAKLERKSGIFRIKNKKSKKSYIGITKNLYQCINGNIFSPSQWKRRPDFELFKDLMEYGEENFSIEICNVGADWDSLLKDRGILINELKPEYNYSTYDHSENKIEEEITPLTDEEKSNILNAFGKIKTYLAENRPDYKELYRSLILVLLYPQVIALNNLMTAAGGDFISGDGSCVIRHGTGKQMLNFSKYSKWLLKGESKSEYKGMGSLEFLRLMLLVLDFKPMIENELKEEFETFIENLKEGYKNHYSQDFTYNTELQSDLENGGFYNLKKWTIVGEVNKGQTYYRLDNNPNRAAGLTERNYVVLN